MEGGVRRVHLNRRISSHDEYATRNTHFNREYQDGQQRLGPARTPIFYPFNLYSEWDDAEDLAYKNILVSLVKGEAYPSQAAHQVDTVLMQHFTSKYKLLCTRPKPYQLTPEETARGVKHIRDIASSPESHVELIFQRIAILCGAFPPGHPAQDRIILFLEALRAMNIYIMCCTWGSTRTKEKRSHSRSSSCGHWARTGVALQPPFDGRFHRRAGSDLKNDKEHLRWLNFQSAIARITALGLLECWILYSLDNTIPGGRFYSRKDTLGIACNLFAGAEYRKRGRITKIGRQMWSMERCGLWKQLFAPIDSGEDDRFDMEIRRQVKLALKRMIACEKRGA
ncbi:uncharacterized protein BO97DRAFT_418941 [Aspergillus homomorphus CBS 101889]|uniref:Uncharacterized protein n=1 Tax=Aspergillus homomorphus (strain CBS 101889) TaxID=1450537 RepID=A0A395HHQ1_ASPHC|nr:hypothetical protein BO97DRAFT_418941 [Aspergillus homomorphus CBS 101889]RAL07033.1 hypothetical protein BO97DRAFT_418941 [Aspergillus homomorphus CBS 101889]